MSSIAIFCQALSGDVYACPYQKYMTKEICVWERQGEAGGKEKVLGMQCRTMP